MKKTKIGLAILLSAAMLFSFAACGDTSWSSLYNNSRLSAGVYIMAVTTARKDAGAKFDTQPADIFKEKIDDIDANTWMTNRTQDIIREYYFVEQKFSDLGLSFTQDELNNITTQIDTEWNTNSAYYDTLGISKDSLSLFLTNYYFKKPKVFFAMYGTGGEKAVSDADLKAEVDNNYNKISYWLFNLNDSTGAALSDTDAAAVKADAQKYVDSLKAGAYFMDVQAAYATDQAAKSGSAAPTGPFDATTEKNYIVIFKADPADEVVDFVSKMGVSGIATFTSSDNYYFIIDKFDISKDPNYPITTTDTASALYKDNVLYNMKYKGEFTTWVTDSAKSLTVDFNKTVVNKYTPKKVYAILTKADSAASAASSSAS